MHRIALLFGLICFILAAAGSYFGAIQAVDRFEKATEKKLEQKMFISGNDWGNIRANGLRLHLTGLAPNESARFDLLKSLGKLVEASRIRDEITLLEEENLIPPKFSLEALRNDDRISLIGLIPKNSGRTNILSTVNNISSEIKITDMLEEVDYPIPANWKKSLNFGLESLSSLKRSKVSITGETVVISAITDSQNERSKFERMLLKKQPPGIKLTLNISAPRPVISPFTIRFSKENNKIRLDNCSADTKNTESKILKAAKLAGMLKPGSCDIGLGVPTPDWAEAVSMSIEAVVELGNGSLTFTDSDISLIASPNTSQKTFDNVIGKLENNLPGLFSLSAILPEKDTINGETGETFIPDFTATISPEGSVQLRGRLPSNISKDAVEAYAKSLFVGKTVYVQTRLDPNLPDGWPMRVLGGLEALGELNYGVLIVEPKEIKISGVSGNKEATGKISRILSVRVGSKGIYKISTKYNEKFAPKPKVKSARLCESEINTIISNTKIRFEPGKVIINDDNLTVIKSIADVLRTCPEAKFEIQGHTDSSGSEELNQNLSQSRAEAVLFELLNRRVLTSGISAKGYGSISPIADNKTEEGREINRRIEIKLLVETTKDTNKVNKKD
ncbi:OmpA family protein [Amylibacter sp.]|nr:OmpA family protein [Amylibacter sp.]